MSLLQPSGTDFPLQMYNLHTSETYVIDGNVSSASVGNRFSISNELSPTCGMRQITKNVWLHCGKCTSTTGQPTFPAWRL